MKDLSFSAYILSTARITFGIIFPTSYQYKCIKENLKWNKCWHLTLQTLYFWGLTEIPDTRGGEGEKHNLPPHSIEKFSWTFIRKDVRPQKIPKSSATVIPEVASKIDANLKKWTETSNEEEQCIAFIWVLFSIWAKSKLNQLE